MARLLVPAGMPQIDGIELIGEGNAAHSPTTPKLLAGSWQADSDGTVYAAADMPSLKADAYRRTEAAAAAVDDTVGRSEDVALEAAPEAPGGGGSAAPGQGMDGSAGDDAGDIGLGGDSGTERFEESRRSDAVDGDVGTEEDDPFYIENRERTG